MSKSTLAKIAAIVCSAASLSMLGMAASAQTDEDVNPGKVTKTQIIAGKVTAEPGEIVKFPVYVYQPEGTAYAATGLRLIYAEGLTPNLNDKGKVVTKKGEAGDDITMTFSTNDEKRIIGLGTMGADGEADSGLMYTVEIKVPDDASGEYPMTLEVERWLDVDVQAIEYETVAGYIKVNGPTTTTATTSTTPAPTTTTTTSTTPAPTTTTTTTTTVSNGSTTTTTTTTGGSTTTTKATTTTAAATTTKGSGSTTATKTGDAGVGVAVAGLMIAAGTAIAATKKKKED